MAATEHTFHVADYAIFGVTLVVALGIGVYYALTGGRQRTTSEFFVGGRKMSWLPVTISLLATFESSIMMLGLPAEAYVYGIQIVISYLGSMMVNFLQVFVAVPLFYPLKITSVYEYLELRYDSKGLHKLASLLGILSSLLYMGVVLYGPALALDAVTGFPQIWSILIIGLGSTVYTSIGGLKAVIWTDVFQAAIMLTGVFAVLIKGTMVAGGPAAVWNIANEGGRLNFFNFDPDPTIRHTFWNLLTGSLIRGMNTGFQQSTVQRIVSQKSIADARKIFIAVSPTFVITLSLATYEGIVAYAYYTTLGCDPLAAGKISNPNQIIVLMVMEIFQFLPGMAGIFLAALFSASLSTLSSALSSSSTNLWQDFVKPHIGNVSEFKATFFAKCLVVLCGVLACGVSVLVSYIGGPLGQISTSLTAAFTAPLCGLFLLSCFCPWVNKWGAWAGTVSSILVSCYLSFGSSFAKIKTKSTLLPPAPTNSCVPLTSNSSLLAGVTDIMLAYNSSESIVETGLSTLGNLTVSMTTASFTQITDSPPVGLQKLLLMSYTLFVPFGVLVSLVIGIAASLLTGANRKKPVDPIYLIPIFDTICFYLPEKIRQVLRCHVDYSTVQRTDNKWTEFNMEVMVSDFTLKEQTKDLLDHSTYADNVEQPNMNAQKALNLKEST